MPDGQPHLRMMGSDVLNSFSQNEDSLLSCGIAKGNRLYMPTLICLCDSYSSQKYTWRELTVADELRIVRPDEARALRIQIGVDQWFVYRNLAQPIRRTALGLHTLADFFAARFDAEDGSFETMVEVEPAPPTRN